MHSRLERFRPAVVLLALILPCLLLAGCNNAATDTPAASTLGSGSSRVLPSASFPENSGETAILTGVVTMDAEEGSVFVLSSKYSEETDGNGDADYNVGFGEDTLFDSAGNPIPYTALAKGVRVEIEFDGVVLESFPALITADKITIMG